MQSVIKDLILNKFIYLEAYKIDIFHIVLIENSFICA